MSDVSSSDDEPMMSSPDNSSNEDSDDNNVFKFHALKFDKAHKSITDLSPSPPSARKRTKKRLSLEDKIEVMEKRKQSRVDKLNRRKLKEDHGDSSDDDHSFEEIRAQKKITPTPPSNKGEENQKVSSIDSDDDVIEIVDPPLNYSPSTRCSPGRRTRSSARASPARVKPRNRNSGVVELLGDSSDSEDDTPRHSEVPLHALKGASREAIAAIQRSRMARSNLTSAQHYHAEDIHVAVQSPPRPTIAVPSIISSPSQEQQPKKDLGKVLSFTCRTKLEFNGKDKKTDDKVLTVREHDNLQVLLDKFLKAHDLLPSAHVTMNFDGLNLIMTRTPASYEMEDEDMIDVTAKAIAIPLQARTNNNAGSTKVIQGARLALTLRRKIGKKVEEKEMPLGKMEPFTVLMESYKNIAKVTARQTISFQFDGETLDLQQTPAQLDMESGDLIDVIAR